MGKRVRSLSFDENLWWSKREKHEPLETINLMLEPPDTPPIQDSSFYFEEIKKAGYPVGAPESWQTVDVINI